VLDDVWNRSIFQDIVGCFPDSFVVLVTSRDGAVVGATQFKTSIPVNGLEPNESLELVSCLCSIDVKLLPEDCIRKTAVLCGNSVLALSILTLTVSRESTVNVTDHHVWDDLNQQLQTQGIRTSSFKVLKTDLYSNYYSDVSVALKYSYQTLDPCLQRICSALASLCSLCHFGLEEKEVS